MKKYILLLAAAAFMAASCDRVYVDEVAPHEPVITTFTPASAPVGAEVTVSGEYLNEVTAAFIGDIKVDIVSKISNTRLVIKVASGVTSGVIKLVNAKGSGSSDKKFQCTFAVPEIAASLLQEEAEMGESIMLSGSHLLSVSKVFFTAEGYTEGHEGQILNGSDEELIVKVPYVENENAHITLAYFDGSGDTTTDLASAPAIRVIRYVPKFNEYTFEKTEVGRSITLTGEYLNNVDRITVNDWDAPLFKSATELTFSIPAGDFKDGETTVEIKAWYFDNNEFIPLSDNFVVFVPFVKFWENVRTWAQGRTEENEFISFFSPETGIAYENSKWRDIVDPISMKLKNAQWSGTGNIPKPGVVSDEDYNSVAPYFFFAGNNDHSLALNSPANSQSQLRNFYTQNTGKDEFRVTQSSANQTGTPILCFRFLNPETTIEAEKELINKVLEGRIENINEELFPIDVDASTIAGIGVSSFTGSANSSSIDWLAGRKMDTLVAEKDYKLNSIFLIAYYSNNGYSKETPAKNIKRLGILRMKSIDFGIYNNTNYAGSCFTYDVYWQKYDYDYSKL